MNNCFEWNESEFIIVLRGFKYFYIKTKSIHIPSIRNHSESFYSANANKMRIFCSQNALGYSLTECLAIINARDLEVRNNVVVVGLLDFYFLVVAALLGTSSPGGLYTRGSRTLVGWVESQ